MPEEEMGIWPKLEKQAWWQQTAASACHVCFHFESALGHSDLLMENFWCSALLKKLVGLKVKVGELIMRILIDPRTVIERYLEWLPLPLNEGMRKIAAKRYDNKGAAFSCPN